jgi:hypothetical protein
MSGATNKKEQPYQKSVNSANSNNATSSTDLPSHQTNIPKLRDLILAAEEVTLEMTQQVKQILKHDWSVEYDNYCSKSKSGNTGSSSSSSSSGSTKGANTSKRQPPHPSAWVTPRNLKDLSIAVVGLGQIGAPLCDILVRSGLRELIVYDRCLVQHSDIACGVYKPSFVGHSKSQAVQLSCFQLDNTIHVEAYTMEINSNKDKNNTLSRFHQSLLAPEFIGSKKNDDWFERKISGNDGSGMSGDANDDEEAIRNRKRKDGSSYLDMEKRKKVDLVACCVGSTEVRSSILHVCKSLNVPMVAIRILNSSNNNGVASKQGTVEFVLPRESKLYEPKKEEQRTEKNNHQSSISNKVQPIGLLLAGLGANEIIKVISSDGNNGGVPSFLRYDSKTGETSHRLPKRHRAIQTNGDGVF